MITIQTQTFEPGYSLIELLVAISILTIMLGIGIPSFSSWIYNTQVRSTAESLLAAMQLARGEAVKQNGLAQLKLTGNAGGSASWTVISASSSVSGSFDVADGAISIQSANANETGANARLGVSTAIQATSNCCSASITGGTGMAGNPAPGIVFNAFGKVVADASVTTITRIDVSNAGDTEANNEEKSRRRVILIPTSGSAKMCRPSLPASNSQGCP